ncbi:hypothetical protein SCG7086_AN_00120 [Chlamydiales bacterium SCGC AG-110-P3]|nr:hypothetical protein SCG7086_AN_00120 [Chlamydiales bacterium SCGC AG-110-P3]
MAESATDDILDQFNEDFALLVEAGFVAVKQLDEISATRLFEAAQMLDPESPAPQIGLGYIALNKLEVAKATAIFKGVLKEEPEHHLALAFLAVCYMLKKETRKKGEELVKKVQEETDDQTIINLCKVSLDWSKKDLRAAKAPFFQDNE